MKENSSRAADERGLTLINFRRTSSLMASRKKVSYKKTAKQIRRLRDKPFNESRALTGLIQNGKTRL
jgi:hypothetical protein